MLIRVIMIIKFAKPTLAAVMVILLVGTAVVDAQGNAEAEFTLRGIKTNNPTTFGDNIPHSSDKEKRKQLTSARVLTAQFAKQIISREDYCRFVKDYCSRT